VYTEFYNEGARMQTTYRFYETATEITLGDYVNPELHLFNSYDTSWPFIVILSAFRLVCTNGLVIGNKFLHLRKRHVYDFEQIDLGQQITSAMKRFRSQTNQWQKWTDRTVTEKDYKRILKVMKFGKNATMEIKARTIQEAEDLNDIGFPIMPLWIFYNIITWYITHRAVSLNHRVEMERRLRTALRVL